MSEEGEIKTERDRKIVSVVCTDGGIWNGVERQAKTKQTYMNIDRWMTVDR